MHYYVWFDDSAKKSTAEKMQEAITAYATRFATTPNLVLVNTADQIEFGGVLVRSERTVQPNTFWVGVQEDE